MSVDSLIQKHGVTVQAQQIGTSQDLSGAIVQGYTNSGGTFLAFVQPQAASDAVRGGSDEELVTHKVYLSASESVDTNFDRLVVTDGSLTLKLDVVGHIRPGLFRSGALGVIVVDCTQDRGLDA
jgi:hypothetical protein